MHKVGRRRTSRRGCAMGGHGRPWAAGAHLKRTLAMVLVAARPHTHPPARQGLIPFPFTPPLSSSNRFLPSRRHVCLTRGCLIRSLSKCDCTNVSVVAHCGGAQGGRPRIQEPFPFVCFRVGGLGVHYCLYEWGGAAPGEVQWGSPRILQVRTEEKKIVGCCSRK